MPLDALPRSRAIVRRFSSSRSMLGVAAVLLVGLAVAFLMLREPPVKPVAHANVLLITLDTTRSDHLSCYGYEHNTSPHLDALADDGLLFERCIAASNWTLPTHASMLTGLYPPRHGAHLLATGARAQEATLHSGAGPEVLHDYLHGSGVLHESCTTLAEVLRQAGRRTGAIVANRPSLQRAYQLDQGFDYYDDAAGESPAPYRDARIIADEALEWLDDDRSKPFFLFLNFMDPHAPYNPPAEYLANGPGSTAQPREQSWQSEQELWSMTGFHVMSDKRQINAEGLRYFTTRYDGEIGYMDAQIGRILAWLREKGLYDSTLIIVTSDHGEAFGEHFIFGHGFRLYEPEVQVPMLVKLPGGQRKGRIDRPVHHVDVMPTVLQLLDLPPSAQMHGVSLLSSTSRDLFVQQNVFLALASVFPWCNRAQWAVYRDHLKYIEYSNGDQELYDFAQDPGERNNLASSRPRDVHALQQALQQWKEQTRSPIPPAPPSELDPETAEQLRDLGYVQ